MDGISGALVALAQRAEHATPVEAGDYERDGILYCGKCNTPKQTVIEIGGKKFKPYCLCRCESEAYQEREAERKQFELETEIRRLRRAAFSERMMEDWTFANDDLSNEKLTNAMRRYAEKFSEMRVKGKGLLLYGTVGTGKTYAACEVANALIDRGIPCLVTNFAQLANRIQGLYEDRQDYIDSLSRYDLLVIDDLGAERKSEFMQEMVFNIVDARYRSGLPMIVTSNLTIEQIKSPENANYSRIYDRIIERCFPVEVSGKSRRRKAVREDYDDMKALLGL